MPDLYVSKNPEEEKIVSKPENITPTPNPLAAIIEDPDLSAIKMPVGIHFEIQDNDEVIILLLRRHWVTNIPWILTSVLFIAAPVILTYFPMISFLPARYQFMSILMWYLLTTAFVFEKFLSWYFNVYMVTNERVIDYDFYNLLYKQVTDADLEKIQDVSAKMGGVSQAVFNYGDIRIQTAGEIPNLEFEKVPNPAFVTKVLHDLRDKVGKGEL